MIPLKLLKSASFYFSVERKVYTNSTSLIPRVDALVIAFPSAVPSAGKAMSFSK